MNINFIKIILIFIALIFISCSCTRNKISDTNNLIYIESDINSWVNLMPGADAKFFVSGSLKFKNEDRDSVKLNFMEVIQNENIIYKFHPEFYVEKDNELVYLNFNNNGEIIGSEIDYNKFVKINFHLALNNESVIFTKDSIKVEKAY